jgi:hypothetical protein
MLTTMNLPGGLVANGFQVVGSPTDTTGKVFYVSSTSDNCQDDPSHGRNPDRPFATIAYAVTQVRASKGDVVVIMPAHVETVATAGALTFSVAGVTYWGLGAGASRPKINLTATAATVVVSAASNTFINLLFTGGIDAIVTPILVQAADCRFIGLETRDVTGQAIDFITTNASADRLLISGWVHRGDSAAGADTAISIVGGDGIRIENFHIYGNFAVAGIENVTTAMTNAWIGGGYGWNFIRTYNSADVLVTCVATSTVTIGPNIAGRLQDNAANITEAYVAAAGQFIQPLPLVNADGESSLNSNITASADA